MCRIGILSLAPAALLGHGALAWAVDPAIPDFKDKPRDAAGDTTWKCLLVTTDSEGIEDGEFANWVKAAQGAGPAPKFSFIATFCQCHSGGFVEELATKGVKAFGANSACRYFETALYHPVNDWSYYAHAWEQQAGLGLAPGWTDKKITAEAYDSIKADVGGVQHAQYKSVGGGGPPPEPLKAAAHNYAILYSGRPEGATGVKDKGDVSAIFSALVSIAPGGYNYPVGDVYILYGDGAAPAGVAWAVNAAATKANLEKAIKDPIGWLQAKLAANPGEDTQVFFWAGDHGTVDTPISFSVDSASNGQAPTAVRVRAGAASEQSMVYEGGSKTNVNGWEIPAAPPAPLIAADDINAVSFGNDYIPVTLQAPYYFSVDRGSVGAALSHVAVEVAAAAKSAAPDVFTAGVKTNRQTIDGQDRLGLEEPILGGGAGADDLNALSFVPIATVLKVPPPPPLTVPMFFSVVDNPNIYVADPHAATPPVYVYMNWGGAVPPPIEDLDALVLKDDFARLIGGATPNQLWFSPVAGDQFLFSVARRDPAAAACDILDPTGAVVATCDDIGLLNEPLVDVNTNGHWDPEEVFTDVNGNGVWDQDNLNALDTYNPDLGVNKPGQTLCGDFNRDLVVDQLDFDMLVAAFGSQAGDPAYLEEADLDADGLITFIDYQAWVDCYRQANNREWGQAETQDKPEPQNMAGEQAATVGGTLNR